MKKILKFIAFGLLFSVFSVNGFAQNTVSDFKLETIRREKPLFFNFRPYWYGDQNLNTARKLQVPIMAIKDPEAKKYYRSFQILSGTGSIIFFTGALYYLGGFNFNRNMTLSDYQTRNWVILGTYTTSLTLLAISISHLDKAIARYNKVISGGKVGISLQTIPNQPSLALGIGFKKYF